MNEANIRKCGHYGLLDIKPYNLIGVCMQAQAFLVHCGIFQMKNNSTGAEKSGGKTFCKQLLLGEREIKVTCYMTPPPLSKSLVKNIKAVPS
jgi:hypothetical protein